MRTLSSLKKLSVIVAAGSMVAVAGINAAFALHDWNGFHWARASNPFTVKLGDNVSAAWDSYLATASSDWSASSVLDTAIVPGQGRKNCRPTSGRVEVCNSKYGNNGWLGVAQVWISGSHITQGIVKMNDTYFNKPAYNTPAWRNLVLCQEVGHTLGLDHQDENFSNTPLGTCMDYTSDPTPNQHPNAHDYEELESIYAHLDGFSTLGAKAPRELANGDADGPAQWGKIVRRFPDGRPSVYVRELAGREKVFTFVVWADGEGEQH